MFTREEISDGIMRINAMIEQRGLGLSPSQQNALRQDGASLNVRIADFEAGKGSWNAVSDAFTTFSKSAELVFGDEPVGATPVPAPAAPTPPATPASPVTPVVPPSSPGMDLESMKHEITSAVQDGVIELLKPMAQVLPSDKKGFLPVASKAAVDELDERVKVLETSSKGMSFGGWLSASITTIVVGVIAFWAMTIGQMGDTIKFVAAPFIGVVFGLVAFVIANTITAMRTRSSQNAA